MPDPGAPPVLSATERETAEALLSAAGGEPAEISTAELVWGRSHIVRLAISDGRSAILKPTMRPRLLSWTARFAAAAATTGTFPRLRQVAEDLNDRLRSLWPDVVIPAYPALAGPGSTLARPPTGWEPGS